MPNPNEFDNKDDFMNVCIPKLVDEGKDQDQAVAACNVMWEKKSMTEKATDIDSLEETVSDVCMAFCEQFPNPNAPMEMPSMPPSPYVIETYPDYVIVGLGEDYFRVNYTQDVTTEMFTFDTRDKWIPVEKQWVDTPEEMPKSVTVQTPTVTVNIHTNSEKPVKVGGRHNRNDQKYLNDAHDAIVKAGAMCGPSGKNIENDDSLVSFGDVVKAVKLADGSVKLGGYLVRYSTEQDPDLTGDFFTKNTDYGDAVESDSWFNHRLPVKFDGASVEYKDKFPAKAKLQKDDVGVFAEIVLKARNAYEEQIAELALAGKLGWSSGTAAHLVDRKPAKNGTSEITRWILGLDASVTPTPAEPRNSVVPIKSLFTPEQPVATASGDTKPETQSIKESIMNDETKALVEELVAKFTNITQEATKSAADNAVKAYAATEPEVKAGNVDSVVDEADRAAKLNPFKSAGEFLMAVRTAAIAPHMLDKRLLPLQDKDAFKANGLNEAIPSQGGFLVQPQYSAVLRELMYKTGSLLALFKPDPVTGNSMTYNIVDETSRADGSRFGGVQGYWMAEGGTKTSSKPKFRQLELKLKKVAALCYATDENLEDAPNLESWLLRNVPNELRFKVEDAYINGDGVGKPQGILASGALNSVTRINANAITATDIGNMWAARWAGYDDYVWIGNQSIFPQLLTMSIGQQPVFITPGGLSNLPYSTLLGRPYFDTEYCPALGTAGDLMLVSPSAYQVIEKGAGIQSASSIHVQFVTDETAYRFVYRVDASSTWTTTLTGKDSNTYSPFVVMSASS